MLSSTMEQFVMQELGLNETVWVDAGGDAGVGQCGRWSLEGRAEWRVNTVPQAARSQALPPASMASTPNLQLTASEHNFPTQKRQLWALLD